MLVELYRAEEWEDGRFLVNGKSFFLDKGSLFGWEILELLQACDVEVAEFVDGEGDEEAGEA